MPDVRHLVRADYSNMATVAAVRMADWLEDANVGALWLLVGFIVVTPVLGIIIPGVITKWAIFAPIFVALFIRLGVAPQTLPAAYRVADGPVNVVTPLMVYLPFIVLLTQKDKKDAGVGTVVSLVIPYTLIVALGWTLFFVPCTCCTFRSGPGHRCTSEAGGRVRVVIDEVARALTETAEEAIMPRFLELAEADVSEKAPGEVVAVADRSCRPH